MAYGMIPYRSATMKKTESLALASMIVVSAFMTLGSSIFGGMVPTVNASGSPPVTSQTVSFQPVEYTVPNIYTVQLVDLKATFENSVPYKVRFRGTIKFSASAWNLNPRTARINVGIVPSKSQSVTNAAYSYMRSGGDAPEGGSILYTQDEKLRILWPALTGRSLDLGTMLTDIHPDANGVELATAWWFYQSGGNQQQRTFDFTMQFSGLSWSRMFLWVFVMDAFDWDSGILKIMYFDGLLFAISTILPLPDGVDNWVIILGSWVDVLESASGQDRGNVDVLWIIPTGECVDAEELDWTSGGNTIPQRTTNGGEYFYGGDAMRLGDTGWKDLQNNQESFIQTTVIGPGTVSFYWKVSSEANWDYLRFYIDGSQQASISGSVGWQFKSFSVGSGSHTLKWVYTKDGSVSVGSDCGWVDRVVWNLGYLQGGLKGKYYDNKDLTDYMFSRVEPTINFDWGSGSPDSRIGSDTFSIVWEGRIRCDYHAIYAFFVVTDDGSRLWVNGVLLIDTWCDQPPTEHVNWCQLEPGYYDIRYEYYENAVTATAKLLWIVNGLDDPISIPKQIIPSSYLYYSPAKSIGEAVENTQLSWTIGGDGNWHAQTAKSYYGGDAVQSGAITHNQQEYFQTTVTGSGTVSFYWKVSSESGYDYLRFYIDGVEKAKISGDTDWQLQSFCVDLGSHTLKWAYTKDGSVSARSDCGWVDWITWDAFKPQLREFDFAAWYDPNVQFAKQTNGYLDPGSLRIDSYSAGSSSLGRGYAFFSVRRSILQNARITVAWNVYHSYPDTRDLDLATVYVFDAAFDRRNIDSYFKPNQDREPMSDYTNVRALLYPFQHKVDWNGWFVTTSDPLNLASWTSEYVTVLIRMADSWIQDTVMVDIDNLKISDASGNTLLQCQFSEVVIMEQTGTLNDYGILN